MDKQNLDRIKGCIFGHAVGDALGLGAEFLSKSELKFIYPNGLRCYEDIPDSVIEDREDWKRGEWTDDTEQMLCILDSIVEKGNVDILDIAKNLYDWAFSDGRGMGNTFHKVITAYGFLTDPESASKKAWINSGCTLAPNGGVMRTSILGVWQYWDEISVIKNAENVCRITHFDHRCVGSCVIISTVIARLISGKEIQQDFLNNLSQDYDPRILEYIEKAISGIESLGLDDPDSMGYTLKTLGAGIWSMIHPDSFEDGLVKVINEGGDADTNGAVVGAVLGAKFGFSSIPKHLINGLFHREVFESKISKLIELISNQWRAI